MISIGTLLQRLRRCIILIIRKQVAKTVDSFACLCVYCSLTTPHVATQPAPDGLVPEPFRQSLALH